MHGSDGVSGRSLVRVPRFLAIARFGSQPGQKYENMVDATDYGSGGRLADIFEMIETRSGKIAQYVCDTIVIVMPS